MAMRLRECAVHMDNAHMREYADADENLIHIYQHTQYYRGKKWAKTKYQKEFFHRVILWGTYLRYVDFRRILAVEMLKLFATVSEIYGQMMIFLQFDAVDAHRKIIRMAKPSLDTADW